MNLKYFFIIIVLLSLGIYFHSNAQSLVGNIHEVNENNEKIFLPGVNIHWLGTTVGTTTDEKGRFVIIKKGINTTKLVVSLIGYKTDTIEIRKEITKTDIKMKQTNVQLEEVEVTGKQDDSFISKLSSRKIEVLTVGELQRAACCNLSESFETNASVDVSYSDAITGAKQIQLLGLSGLYIQLQTENIPSIRGLASTYGLNYIPGSWMESIQISKGTSSVINGYESITGQINVEYKKPTTKEKLHVNIYGNNNERMEMNVNSSIMISDRLQTAILIHGDYYGNKINIIDSTKTIISGNEVMVYENFMDLPKLNTVNVFNRWDYMIPGKYETRFGVKYLEENREGGTLNFNKNTFELDTAKIRLKTLPYGFGLNTKRTEAFWKNGIMFADKPWKSIGIILSGVNHEQTGFFGVNDYHGYEKTLYANFIYQSIISNTNHKFSTGLSYLLDDYNESYYQIRFYYKPGNVVNPDSSLVPYEYKMDRKESVPGAFFEYTYSYLDVFTFIAGVRADYHNIYGVFVTPRTNLRYQLNETTVIRASAGLGYRTANILSENLSMLASQRILVIAEDLKQEKAANYGFNISKEFKLFKKKFEVNLDLYRTDFFNQIIIDADNDPKFAYFYNLQPGGKSYANSAQIQLSVEPIERFRIVVAYRINDAKQTIDDTLRAKLLQPRYKGLVTMSYATRYEKWKFDITAQFNGRSRISPQNKMPASLRRNYEYSPEYMVLNAQVSKKFKHNFDAYIGGENLLNFIQKDPLTQPQAPYHNHFDTTMVWGPVVGRVIYAGLRYTFN